MGSDSWNGAGSGNWGSAASWSTGLLPIAGDIVRLPGTAAYSVGFTLGSATIAGLEITDPAALLGLNGGVLQIGGGALVGGLDGPGSLVSTGSVTIGAGLTLGGLLQWQDQGLVSLAGTLGFGDLSGGTASLEVAAGGTLALGNGAALVPALIAPPGGTASMGSGQITSQGVISLDGGVAQIAVPLLSTGTLQALQGTLELGAGGTLGGNIGGGAGIIALAGGTYDLAGNPGIGGNFAQTGGAIALGAGQTLTLTGSDLFGLAGLGGGAIDGPGTLVLAGSASVLADAATQLTLGGGADLVVAGSLAIGGPVAVGDLTGNLARLDVAAGGHVALTTDYAGFFSNGYFDAADNYQQGSGLIANAGWLAKTGGSGVSELHVALANTGTLLAQSGTLALDGGGTLGGVMQGAGGVLALDGGVFGLGAGSATSFTILGTVAVDGGTLALGAGNALRLVGQTVIGNMDLASGALVTLAPATLAPGATATLANGSMWLTGNSVQVAGTLIGGGVLSLTSSADLFLTADGAAIDAHLLINRLAIIKTAGAGTATIGGLIIGAGAVGADSGTLALTGGGEMMAGWGGAGGVVALAGGRFWSVTTSLAESGTLALSGGTLALNAGQTLALAGPLALQSGEIDGPGTLSLAAADWSGSVSLGNGVVVENAGTLALGGTLLGGDGLGSTAMLVNQAGATLQIRSGGLLENAALGSGGGAQLGATALVNAGIITTGATGGGTIALPLTSTGTLAVQAGTLALADGGVLGGVVQGAGTLALEAGATELAPGLVMAGAALRIDGGSVLVAAPLATASALTLGAATLELGAGATLSLSGALQAGVVGGAAGTLDGPGTLITGGAVTLVSAQAQALVLGGGIDWIDRGSILANSPLLIGDVVGTAATLDIAASGTLDLATDLAGVGTGLTRTQGGLASSGTLAVGNLSLLNQGLIAKTGGVGASHLDAVLSGAGSIAIAGGTLSLDGGGTLEGAVGGAGTLALGGGAMALAPGLVLGEAGLVLAGATASLDSALGFAGSWAQTSGTLVLGAGAMLDVTGRTALAPTGPAAIDGPGTLTTAQASLNGAAALTLGGGLVWQDTGSLGLGSALWIGDGSGLAAELQVAPRATLALGTDQGGIFPANVAIGGAWRTGQGTLVVQGLLDKTGGSGTSWLEVPLQLTGTLRAESGALALDGGGTLGGSLGGGAGTLDFAGGAYSLTAASTDIAGPVQFAGATLALGSGQRLDISGPLRAAGGEIDGPGTLVSTGAVSLLGAAGMMLGGGAFWQMGGNAQFAGTLWLGDLTGATAGLEIAGMLTLSAGAVAATPWLGAAAGNGPGPAITIAAGASVLGNGLLGVAMTNDGVITAAGGDLTLGGSVTGTGSLQIGAYATLSLGASGEAVSFTGPDATLILTNPSLFTGTLGGLVAGDQVVLGEGRILPLPLAALAAQPPSGLRVAFGTTAQGATTVSFLANMPAIPADFFGNGNSDLLLQCLSGLPALWEISGGALVWSALLPNPGTDWRAIATGDFNGDGHADILWQNQYGPVAVWLMNGARLIGSTVLSSPGAGWHVAATGDFNGDGQTDILWQNNDGHVEIWQMHGLSVSAVIPLPDPGPIWHAVAAGDLSGNGTADIIWQTSDGTVAVWMMHNNAIASGATLGGPGTAWHVTGAVDFTGDGKADLLLQANDGTVAIWRMNGAAMTGGVVLGNPGSNWHVSGAGVMNGGSSGDIFWQSDAGQTALWQVQNLRVVNSGYLAAPGINWATIGSNPMRLIYPANNPIVMAGAEPDEFVLTAPAPGTLTIANFNPALDVVALSARTFNSFAALQTHASAVPGGTMLSLNAHSSVMLQGVSPAALTAGNFAFL